MKLLNQLFLCFILLSGVGKAKADDVNWFGNDHFRITKTGNTVKIAMEKLPWESFSAGFDETISAEGILSLEIKTEQPVLLRVDGFTSSHKQVPLFSEQVPPGEFKQLLFNLAASGLQLESLIFYVNPGETFTGDIYVKSLEVSSPFPGQEALTVYPNPASDGITIQVPGDEFTRLLLYDSAGRVVYDAKPTGRQTRINLKNYKPGSYVLKAQGNSKFFTTKVIVH